MNQPAKNTPKFFGNFLNAPDASASLPPLAGLTPAQIVEQYPNHLTLPWVAARVYTVNLDTRPNVRQILRQLQHSKWDFDTKEGMEALKKWVQNVRDTVSRARQAGDNEKLAEPSQQQQQQQRLPPFGPLLQPEARARSRRQRHTQVEEQPHAQVEEAEELYRSRVAEVRRLLADPNPREPFSPPYQYPPVPASISQQPAAEGLGEELEEPEEPVLVDGIYYWLE